MSRRFLILYSAILLFALPAKAQIKGLDTVEHKRYPIDVKYITIRSSDYYTNIDTTISNLFLFRPIETCYSCIDLGNMGQPGFDGKFNQALSPELQSGLHIFDKSIYRLDDLQFLKVRRPYTDLFFTLGSKSEQVFHATLAERLKDNLFASFNMRYAAASGFYQRQKVPFNNFSGTLQYTGKKQHFTMRIGFVTNHLRAPLNGGVATDTFINDPLITQKILEPVRSDTAVNRLKQGAYVWQTSYDIGHLTLDSTHKKHIYSLEKRLRLLNTFTYEKAKYIFSDDSSDVVNYFVPFPSHSIQDSVTQHYFSDEFGLTIYHKNPLYFSAASGGVNYIRLFQPLQHNFYTQYFVKYADGGMLFNIVRDSVSRFGCRYLVKGEYAVSQSLSSSYTLSENLNIDANSARYKQNNKIYPAKSAANLTRPVGEFSLGALLQQSSTPPALLQSNYQTNLYQWQNNFKNVITIKSEVYVIYKSVELRLANNVVTNYVYCGLDALPHQNTGTMLITQAELKGRFKIWRRLYTSQELLYQKIGNTDIVSLPAMITRSQFYFESDAFKKASHVQLGIMIRYWSDYYAPAYLPATMQFNLQQEKVVKYLPVYDVFTSMQIKTAQLFLRFAIIGNYINKNINFGALHYPLQEPSIHFGVKWTMWN